MHITYRIPFFLRILAACLALAVLCIMPCRAADLPRQEAERILQDTYIIAGYVGLNGESDYAGRPQNVIMAALFGAYDAKMAYVFEQDRRKEAGEKPLPASTPLFTVAGRAAVQYDFVDFAHDVSYDG